MRAISRGVGLKPFASYRLADNRLVQCYHHDMAGVFNRGIVFPHPRNLSMQALLYQSLQLQVLI